MKRHLVLLAAALFVLAAVPASAQYWSQPGSAGIVDESAAGLYEMSGATLKFKSGATGTIVARYPILSPVSANPGWSSMRIGYSGTGVTVKLYEVFECLPIQTLLTTFGPTNADAGLYCDGHIFTPPAWNFAQHTYYVEVTLTRSSTAQNPQIHNLQFP